MSDRPIFTETAPAAVEAEVMALWADLTGKSLPPGAAERLMLNLITYREAIQRIGRQWGFEQCLVNYAQSDRLDELAVLVGVERLPAQPSVVTLLVTLDPPKPTALVMPAGTLAIAGTLEFATDAELIISAGDTFGITTATCTTSGLATNGVEIGAVTTLSPAIAGVTVTNLTISSGGVDIELDERLRIRTKEAPHTFTTAGTRGQYQALVRSASQAIIDIAIVQPYNAQGGLMRLYLDIYILTAEGAPSDELAALVQSTFDRDDLLPICDMPTVRKPVAISVVLNLVVVVLDGYGAAEVEARVTEALAVYVADRRSRLGADIVRSQIMAAVTIEGVYSTEIFSPPTDITVAPSQWADVSVSALSVAGLSEG